MLLIGGTCSGASRWSSIRLSCELGGKPSLHVRPVPAALVSRESIAPLISGIFQLAKPCCRTLGRNDMLWACRSDVFSYTVNSTATYQLTTDKFCCVQSLYRVSVQCCSIGIKSIYYCIVHKLGNRFSMPRACHKNIACKATVCLLEWEVAIFYS